MAKTNKTHNIESREIDGMNGRIQNTKTTQKVNNKERSERNPQRKRKEQTDTGETRPC